MFENEDEKPIKRLPTRQSIHEEIEETLIKKLFSVIKSIEQLPDGNLNFKPYTDHELLQIETYLEKNFDRKVFKRDEDKQISSFLELVKVERERRDFGILFNR
ncbi:MAG: hypothetical protein HZR80_20570 [Candidatus Heimdallarchaeota archaeon]